MSEKAADLHEIELNNALPTAESIISSVQIINEKDEQLPTTDTKQEDSESPPADSKCLDGDILQANRYDQNRRYVNDNQGGYGQTPYYQQQHVAGQPIYVAGQPPAPVNVRVMPAYRRRDDRSEESIGNNSIFTSSFDTRVIRNRFVQRVYTILSFMLAYACGFIALCVFEENTRDFVTSNFLVFVLMWVTFIIVYIVLMCCRNVRRIFPINFILLAIITVTFSYGFGVISAMYSTNIVMTSMGITAGVCLLISIFAIQTSCDVTGCGMYLCVASLVICIFGIIAMFIAIFTGSRITFIIYAGLIAMLFSMYLMYDTQQIIGGRKIELSPEEYISGALHLFIDIMYIFWAILTIMGFARGE